MKKITLILLASVVSCFSAITANFNAPFSGGVTGNFSNADGTTFNGLTWGILVDANNDGTISPGGTTSGIFTGTNDVFIEADLTTGFLAGGTEGDFLTTETQGSLLGGVSGIDASLANLAFSVVWLDDSTSQGTLLSSTATDNTFETLRSIGVLSDASFVLGADGTTNTYDSVFQGADAVRTADSETLVIGEQVVPINVVPEPTSGALLGLAGLALVARRKR